MITWLVGENSFEVREALKALAADFSGTVEYADGAELSLAQLPDLLMGVSLFAPERLVVISDLSQNAAVWEKLPDWLSRIGDDMHVVFVDAKPDKRTSVYKALKAAADVKEFPLWSDREVQKVEQWVVDRAQQQGVSLNKSIAQHLVSRVGLDPWRLAQALETLSLLDVITIDTINNVIPPDPRENIFQLFETALEGKTQQVAEKLATLTLHEDPYAFFALLSSQAMTLAAVTYADGSAEPSKDFAIHPFVASKLARHGKKLGKSRVGAVLEAFAKTDADMKRSKAEPWLLIERTLITTAHIAQ